MALEAHIGLDETGAQCKQGHSPSLHWREVLPRVICEFIVFNSVQIILTEKFPGGFLSLSINVSMIHTLSKYAFTSTLVLQTMSTIVLCLGCKYAICCSALCL